MVEQDMAISGTQTPVSEHSGKETTGSTGSLEIAPRHRPSMQAEQINDYPSIVVAEAKVRVIVCRDGIQWIVQRLSRGRWEGHSFCRTREALIRVAGNFGMTAASLAVLAELPARINAGSAA